MNGSAKALRQKDVGVAYTGEAEQRPCDRRVWVWPILGRRSKGPETEEGCGCGLSWGGRRSCCYGCHEEKPEQAEC